MLQTSFYKDDSTDTKNEQMIENQQLSNKADKKKPLKVTIPLAS